MTYCMCGQDVPEDQDSVDDHLEDHKIEHAFHPKTVLVPAPPPTPPRGIELDGPCGKKTYPTLADAEAEIARCRANPASWRKEDRAYSCRTCVGWHLTSRPRIDLDEL